MYSDATSQLYISLLHNYISTMEREFASKKREMRQIPGNNLSYSVLEIQPVIEPFSILCILKILAETSYF